MDIKTIPKEIWLEILGYVVNTDLKAVRLAGNAQLSSLASSLLFTTAFIAARKGVLDVFAKLTTHPEFRNYVKHIVYDSSYFDPEVVESYDFLTCQPKLSAMFREQEEIISKHLQPCIEKALDCLTNVKSVHYADMSRKSYLPGDGKDPSWDFEYHHGPLDLRLESANHRFDLNSKSMTLDSDNDPAQRQMGGLFTLIESLSKHVPSTLYEVSLGDSMVAGAYGVIPIKVFAPAVPRNLSQHLSVVFGRLRKVHLSLSFSVRNEGEETVFATDEDSYVAGHDVLKVLTSARNLEELKLVSEYQNYPLRLGDTFATFKWEKLRLLYTRNFSGAMQDLLDLIERHAKSLRHMTIDKFRLLSGQWSELKEAFPDIAPDLELTFGHILGKNKVEELFMPENTKCDESGLRLVRDESHEKGEEEEEGEGDEEEEGEEDRMEEDEEDATDEESSIDLSYYSDDSSPSTASNPRRKSVTTFLSLLEPDFRAKVERLQHVLEGCSVDQCQIALRKNEEDHERARKALLNTYGVECYGDELRTAAANLEEMMPFDVSERECIEALLESNGNQKLAKKELKFMYGHRQKILMGR